MFSSSVIDIPRPFIDPVESAAQALAIASLVVHRPRRDQTLVLLLDVGRRGVGIIDFHALDHSVMHLIVGACCAVEAVASVVVVSTRHGGTVTVGDIDLHARLSFALAAAGYDLVDWIVCGRGGIYCPRTVIGAADPWPASVSLR